MTAPLQILSSKIDDSVNEIYSDESEFRLVHRENHDTIYCSSHTGCTLGCGMCWLTHLPTKMAPLKKEAITERASRFIPGIRQKLVKFAFMARGDAMLSEEVDGDLISKLKALTPHHSHVGISTIFPLPISAEGLLTRFGPHQPIFYWSLYSLEADVRKKWLPAAGDPVEVVRALLEWQKHSYLEVVIHHPLIKGVNDSSLSAHQIVSFLRMSNLRYRVNLVRYNPPNEDSESASEETYSKHLEIYNRATYGRAKIQERIGFDVSASCGMFVS